MVRVPVQYHRLRELEPESERDSFFRVSEDVFEPVSLLVLPAAEREESFFVSLFGIELTESQGHLIGDILSQIPHRLPAHRVIAMGDPAPCRGPSRPEDIVARVEPLESGVYPDPARHRRSMPIDTLSPYRGRWPLRTTIAAGNAGGICIGVAI